MGGSGFFRIIKLNKWLNITLRSWTYTYIWLNIWVPSLTCSGTRTPIWEPLLYSIWMYGNWSRTSTLYMSTSSILQVLNRWQRRQFSIYSFVYVPVFAVGLWCGCKWDVRIMDTAHGHQPPAGRSCPREMASLLLDLWQQDWWLHGPGWLHVSQGWMGFSCLYFEWKCPKIAFWEESTITFCSDVCRFLYNVTCNKIDILKGLIELIVKK